jgi:hypothetical protein
VLEIFSAETTATASILTTSLTDIQSIGGWLEKKFPSDAHKFSFG